jgi:hypothetical protein
VSEPEPLDLDMLRQAAEAGFHATPPTVLALLDMIDRQARIIVLYLAGHPSPLTADDQVVTPRLHAVPDAPPEPEPEPDPDWDQLALPLGPTPVEDT